MGNGVVKFEGCPCCVDENRANEYTPVSKDLRISIGKKIIELDRIGGRRRISPNRLIDGGADILAAHLRNHHRLIAGNKDNRPLVRYRLRVWVASYEELAMEKSADDDRPCANIITRAPSQPHFDEDRTAAVKRPMCPIDE